ncbi:MAG: glycosyltransferase family 4 protein [Mariprofundaceae bacterium]|nr:glycosyltransferase family 4 protein [Mariprofundaceae bacterium]
MTWEAFVSHALFALVLFLVAWSITRWMIHHTSFIDIPNERSSHASPTPRGGGVSIVTAFLIGLIMIAWIGDRVYLQQQYFVGFVLSAYSIALLSFLDDIHNYRFHIKLLLHCVAIAVVLSAGLVLDQLATPWFGLVSLGVGGYVLTFLWLLGLTNAYNFMDGIDGLAALTAIIAAGFFAYITLHQGSTFVYLVSYTILAGSAGFLYFNRPPAKIFMGDVGSTFLGFTLGCMALIGARYDASHTSFLVMPLLLGHFIFDTVFTMLRRIIAGENPAQAHCSHLYQLLVRGGLSHKKVTLIYAACGTVQGVAAIWMVQIEGSERLFVFVPFLLLYALAAWKITAQAKKLGLMHH